MEIYVRNADFDRIDLLEGPTSLIWTERYSEYGEFTLELPSTKVPYSSIAVNRYLENTDSQTLMRIETVERRHRSQDDDRVIVTGRSFESFLEERYIAPNVDDEHWTIIGNVAWVASQLVKRICVDGTEYSDRDIIPNLIVAPNDLSDVQAEVKQPIKDLYSGVKELCEEDGFGFRIRFDPDTKTHTFKAYRGTDHSSGQNELPVIIFSGDFDVLNNVSTYDSVMDMKNVAYVHAESIIREVYLGSSRPSGLNRRVLYVDANDIKNPTNGKLDSRGRIELRKHRRIRLVDGEVESTPTYKYRRDYSLGSLVDFVDAKGNKSVVRVSEYITTIDEEGVRSYPTFEAID